MEVARRSGWQKTHPTESGGGGGAQGSRLLAKIKQVVLPVERPIGRRAVGNPGRTTVAVLLGGR